MAIETTDYNIDPADGWVEVATAPTYVQIKPSHGETYRICVSDAGAPAAGVRGAVYSDGWPFVYQVSADQGEVYIRVDRKPGPTPLHFAVITDGTPS